MGRSNVAKTYWVVKEGQVIELDSDDGYIVRAPKAPWAVGSAAVAVLDRFRVNGYRVDWAERA